ncbi:hypothetical protein GPECTOR_19g230 [Gonium pectorale]|uniref:F-box domain-containing protein n=1 Tax=Gonium pectorale TaxID=33097 RepID=A0A150GIY6_GONPE|nr:hypothetical protein GPECTOR_19g230 [Gonium pectorale]|eukprot:KXZ49779.1 hypothetical protein GPECTOR_19g230 [Gonium pectorale]
MQLMVLAWQPPPPRDVLLTRLPAPALARIVPALAPATRAALRASCRALRALVDEHTAALTLRPDRRVAEGLQRRGVKALSLFPALRHVTVVLAGSCSGAAGPSPDLRSPAAARRPGTAASGSPHQSPTPHSLNASSRRRPASTALPVTASWSVSSSPRSPTGPSGPPNGLLPPPPPAPLLGLSGWLVVCGPAGHCLTSLSLHLGEVSLLEELALSVTHPHLQRLELHFGLSGNPHATPPVVQFMVGVLSGLRHLRLAWEGGPYAAAAALASGTAGGDRGAAAAAAASRAAMAHGSRRLFLDGRPKLGPLLLAALAELRQLESLELRGFVIDTEGHAVLSRHWPSLAPRLRRLELSGLHLLVRSDTPQDQQLGELVGTCQHLSELTSDLYLPAAPAGMLHGVFGLAGGGPVGGGGVAAALAAFGGGVGAAEAAPGDAAVLAAVPGGGGGGGAAALLISLMYAARDVRAVRPQCLPPSLARLVLPGVVLESPADLEALGRLRCLTSLQLAALGGGASEHLTALQVLLSERLDDWHGPDLALLARVARELRPLVDGGCDVRLKVARGLQPSLLYGDGDSDMDGQAWEPAVVEQ